MKFTSLSNLPEETVSHNPKIQKKVMLRSGDIPHLTYFSQAHFPPGERATAHAHRDMCEVFFVESGEGRISINGTDYALQPGSCAIVEPGEIHEIVNSGSTVLVLTYFGLQVAASDLTP